MLAVTVTLIRAASTLVTFKQRSSRRTMSGNRALEMETEMQIEMEMQFGLHNKSWPDHNLSLDHYSTICLQLETPKQLRAYRQNDWFA